MAWPKRASADKVSSELRIEILQRDGYVCYLCGRHGADQVDHVIPVTRGGRTERSNLRAVHDAPCHRRKTAAEANEARWSRHRKLGRRPVERHPGLKD